MPRQPISTVRVRARNEDFRIVRLSGNLFVCARQHGSCCCGWDEKGRMPFAPALLQIHGRSIWLKDLNDAALIPAVYDCAEAMLDAGSVLPPPAALAAHVYERHLPPPDAPFVPLGVVSDDEGGLERLDPVCLMDVDPATARHTVAYGGRIIAFCAPTCKKQFLADPDAYLVG